MLSRFFINRPKFAIAISGIIIFAGIIALTRLPVQKFPNIVPPQVLVSTSYPGADPITLMNTVIEPIETAVNGVQEMIYMSSKANSDGSCSVTVSFKVGTNPIINTINVQNRVQQALSQLPPEVRAEGVDVIEYSSDMLMWINAYTTGNLTPLFMENYGSVII
jgi:hydrophobic/amphiphilic exporter-1 (mainly G- bacteria), HAE1 family